MRRQVFAFIGIFVIGLALPAAGQETRDDALAAEQAAKSTQLHPYVPDRTERRIQRVAGLLTATPTVYTFFGGVYPGGQLAVGPGFRKRYADSGTFDVHGAWSIKNYKLIDTTLGLPEFADKRVKIDVHGQWIDAPSVAFYGTGNASQFADDARFLYRSTTAGVSARVRAARFASVGAAVDVLDLETGAGKRGTSIEQRFTAADAAGLRESPRYTRSQAFAEFDWRQSPGYTTRGGRYRVDWFNYDEMSDGTNSFRRIDTEIEQFVPLLRANWVLAFRALGSFTEPRAGNAVPYFLLPDLGGSRVLRGYPSWRFRDQQRVLLSGEYRWTAGQFVDMALFLDAGQVAARRSDIRFEDFHKGYGIGVRLHTPALTALRIEVGRSVEGTRLIFAFGPSF